MVYSVHTLTGDASILSVVTVMKTNSIARAVCKSSLSATTHQIVQEDWSSSLTKIGFTTGNCTCVWKQGYPE